VAKGILLGIVVTCLVLLNKSGFWILPPQIDGLTEEQRQVRLEAFYALGAIHLDRVSEQDKSKAIESMHVSSGNRSSLQIDLAKISANTSQTINHQSGTPTSLATSQSNTDQTSATTASGHQEKTSEKFDFNKAQQMELAWITLWDSDAAGGDMVRIDSEGYSRTILLKELPITFAVPIPTNGIINVVGIRDDDGGGITASFASGNSKAMLPIINVGQVLPLKVDVK
jgi:hypothetical protein